MRVPLACRLGHSHFDSGRISLSFQAKREICFRCVHPSQTLALPPCHPKLVIPTIFMFVIPNQKGGICFLPREKKYYVYIMASKSRVL
jgi:hypothetical protein